MALKIRLRQQGRKNRLVYRLVLTESRWPRDGKYLEMLGWYNPHEKEAEQNCCVQDERVRHWLSQGAQVTPKAEKLLRQQAPAVIEEYYAKRSELAEKVRKKKRAARKGRAEALAK